MFHKLFSLILVASLFFGCSPAPPPDGTVLDFLNPSADSSPVDSTTVGSTTVGSTTVGSTTVGSTTVGSTTVDSTPECTTEIDKCGVCGGDGSTCECETKVAAKPWSACDYDSDCKKGCTDCQGTKTRINGCGKLESQGCPMPAEVAAGLNWSAWSACVPIPDNGCVPGCEGCPGNKTRRDSCDNEASESCTTKPKHVGKYITQSGKHTTHTSSTSSDYTLRVSKKRNLVALQLDPTYYQSFPLAGTKDFGHDHMYVLTKTIYDHFQDTFDFIFFATNTDDNTTPCPEGKRCPEGVFFNAKNATKGIGRKEFDDTGLYGSQGKLSGAVFLRNGQAIAWGPSLHEFSHNWANYLFDGLSNGESVGAHWGIMGQGGQLGGWIGRLDTIGPNLYKAPERESFGPFANGGNGVPYSLLELYLMGLIPPEEVLPMQKAVNGHYNAPIWNEFTADSLQPYTINDVVTTHGPRIPSHETSQKSFRVLFVVLGGTAMTDARFEKMEEYVTSFTKIGDSGYIGIYNFYQATGSRATLDAEKIDCDLKSFDSE